MQRRCVIRGMDRMDLWVWGGKDHLTVFMKPTNHLIARNANASENSSKFGLLLAGYMW